MPITRIILFCLLFSLITYGLNYHISKSLIHIAAFFSVVNIAFALKNRTVKALSFEVSTLCMCTVFLIAAAITIIYTQIFNNPISIRHQQNFAYPLFYFAIILPSVKVTEPDYQLIFYAALIGCLNMAGAGIYDYLQASSNTYRTAGMQNMPIIYASCMALLTSWVAVEFFRRLFNHQWLLMSLCFIALSIGYIAILLTASRGPIIASSVIIIITFAHYLASIPSKKKVIYLLIATGLLSAFSLTFTSQTKLGENILNRFGAGINNLSTFIDGSKKSATSIGIRLDMWQAALETISDNPITGIGPGTHHEHFIALSEQQSNSFNANIIRRFDHVHNDILQILMSFGLIFGSITLLFILYPSLFFIQALRCNPCAAIGLMGCATFILCGLTDATSFRAPSLTLFLLITSLNLVHVNSKRLAGKNA